MPISVSRTIFALRYEVPKFLARGGHLCMAMLKNEVIETDESIDLLRLESDGGPSPSNLPS